MMEITMIAITTHTAAFALVAVAAAGGSVTPLYDGEIVVSIAATPLDTAPSTLPERMRGLMTSEMIRYESASVRALSKP